MKHILFMLSAAIFAAGLATAAAAQDRTPSDTEMLRNYMEVERVMRQMERVGEMRQRAAQGDLVRPTAPESGVVAKDTSPTGPVAAPPGGVASTEPSCFRKYEQALSEIDKWYESCSRACDGFFCELGCSAIARGRETAAGASYVKCNGLN